MAADISLRRPPRPAARATGVHRRGGGDARALASERTARCSPLVNNGAPASAGRNPSSEQLVSASREQACLRSRLDLVFPNFPRLAGVEPHVSRRWRVSPGPARSTLTGNGVAERVAAELISSDFLPGTGDRSARRANVSYAVRDLPNAPAIVAARRSALETQSYDAAPGGRRASRSCSTGRANAVVGRDACGDRPARHLGWARRPMSTCPSGRSAATRSPVAFGRNWGIHGHRAAEARGSACRQGRGRTSLR